MADWRRHGGQGEVPRPIDRIVLYIDDLDRCRPQQVVEVLQAVHLLLALDLFVVVVGVDPRWLLRSLTHQYQGVLDAEPAAGMADLAAWGTGPQDYLEKIFNIPVTLPGMPPGSLGRLIRSLAAAEQPETSPQATGSPAAAARPEELATARAATPAGYYPEIPVQEHSEIARGRAPLGAPEATAPPRPMTEPELALLSELEALVNTPRAAKRLLNLYRTLRSTRDLSAASRFLGEDGYAGDYQAVAVLLGMLVADGRLLKQVLDAQPNPDAAVPGGLMSRPPQTAWHSFTEDLTPVTTDDGWQNRVVGRLPTDDVEVWRRFTVGITSVNHLVTLPDLTAFQQWAPHIRRFSFLV